MHCLIVLGQIIAKGCSVSCPQGSVSAFRTPDSDGRELECWTRLLPEPWTNDLTSPGFSSFTTPSPSKHLLGAYHVPGTLLGAMQ